MITLHRYVLQDLLKTFGLSVVAMTALFTLAGGIYNVVRQEGIGAAQVFTILPLLIPHRAHLYHAASGPVCLHDRLRTTCGRQ